MWRAMLATAFSTKGIETMLFDLSPYLSGNIAIMALVILAIAAIVSIDKKGN